MHIAFFTSEYPTPGNTTGGLANYLKKTGKELQKRGHSVTILFLSTADRSWTDGEVQIVEIKTYGYFFQKVSRIPVLRIINRIVANIYRAWLLKKHCVNSFQNKKIDIIQIPLLPSGGAMALFLLGKRPAPLIGRLSSDTISYQKANKENLKNISHRIITKLESFQRNKLDGLFGPCMRITNIIKKREGINVKVIKTPLELPQQGMKTLASGELPLQKPYFIYFGQFELIKGFDIAIEATKLLMQNNPQVSVLFIGTQKCNSAAAWAEELIQLVSTHKNQVVLLPPQSKDKLYPLIQQSIAVLMPARLDNYPNACLEAQALGKIVIGTYDSCLEEMIVDEQTGYLAKNENITSFYEKMQVVLSLDNKKKRVMEQNILNHIDCIRKEDRIGELIQYYKEVLRNYHV